MHAWCLLHVLRLLNHHLKLLFKIGDLHIELLIGLLVLKILKDQIVLELHGVVEDLHEVGIIAMLPLNLLQLLHHSLHWIREHLSILGGNHIELFH